MITIFLFASAVITSCGGGGGGGGAVSFQGSGAQYHNGGDASGWGTGNQTGNGFNPEGQSIEEAEAGLLISQMAALSGITGITIELTINGTPYPAINADETTTTAVLPKIKAGDKISGKATINLMDAQPRVAYLDETEAALHGVLKFKVPYKYRANDLAGQEVANGTYYARDGINLAAQTVDPIAGWQCVEDGTTHYGSYVTGVRGDITLNAVTADGVPVLSATASPEILYATATSGDTTTITITNMTGTPTVSDYSPQLVCSTPMPDDPSNPTSYTLTVGIATSSSGAGAAAPGPVWFGDSTTANVTITDDSGAIKSVPLTLKNKYSFTVADADGTTRFQDDIMQGTEYSFNDVKGMIPASAVPNGRTVVAFKRTSPSPFIAYKESDFPIKLNSQNFATRIIALQAYLDFTYSNDYTRGGYKPADISTPSDGTSSHPYYVNYYGTGTLNKLWINVQDFVCAANAVDMKVYKNNQEVTGLFTINKTPGSNICSFEVTLNQSLSENDAKLDGQTKLTVTDPTTGAKKDIYVMIRKDQVYTVSFNSGTGGSAVTAQIVASGGKATKPADPTNTDSNLALCGWYTSTDGGVTLSSSSYDFDNTNVTADITLYAKWGATSFTGSFADYLTTQFAYRSSTSSPYQITITSGTLTASDFTSLKTAINSGPYINLDLSGCTLDPSITAIPYDAFSHCTELISIKLPSGVQTISSNAFFRCRYLNSVTIPNGVTKIESSAFEESGLTSVTLPNTLQSLKSYVFRDCDKLTSINIPASVNGIYNNVFVGCRSLTDAGLTIQGNNQWTGGGYMSSIISTLDKNKLSGINSAAEFTRVP